MREIDFRPEHYRTIRSRKRNMVIRAALLTVLAVELGLGSVGTYAQKAATRRDMDELRVDLVKQAGVLRGLDVLLVDLDELQTKRRLLSDVIGGAPVHCVLAELSRLLPDDLVLTEVHIVQRRGIRGAEAVAEVDSESTAPREIDEAGALEMLGFGASDAKVGRFMASMAGSELFSDVSLHYSKSVTLEGVTVQEFRVTGTFPQFE
ncbi:MAG: PilN domain-containing protein [Phycisphaerae bacterium]